MMSQAWEALSREELRSLAKERGLRLSPRAKKAELVAALQSSSPASTPGDLRPDAPPPSPRGLPWGYGETRVAALARDPHWLYVYWEVTDEALSAARDKLGAAGAGAFLVLRTYDTTYRLFDGANANSYFDVPVERAWNNYFLKVDRPRSVFHVEIGLRSHEGYFAAVARSAAAEMPADSVSQDGHAEWMTVIPKKSASKAPTYRHRGTPRPHPISPPAPAAHFAPATAGPAHTEATSASWETSAGHTLSFLFGGETLSGQWFEQVLGRQFVRFVRWYGTQQRTVWHSGPQTIAWQHVGPVEIWFEGQHRVLHGTEGGGQSDLGPWHVVITGLGARGERRVLDTWMVHMGWSAGGSVHGTDSPALYHRIFGAYGRRSLFAGASESLVREEVGASHELFAGASQGLWLGGSEMLLGGASELLALGASELLAQGASEMRWLGASESMLGLGGASLYAAMGASEQRFGGGSEMLLGGASLFAGASELSLAGASKGAFGGASELAFQGGSEAVLGVSSGDNWQGFAAAPTVAGPLGFGVAKGPAPEKPAATKSRKKPRAHR
jgi:hypothetical protein